MAVPKRRTSKSKIGMRRSHDRVILPTRIKCSRCGAPQELHTVCDNCGFYRGRLVQEKEEV